MPPINVLDSVSITDADTFSLLNMTTGHQTDSTVKSSSKDMRFDTACIPMGQIREDNRQLLKSLFINIPAPKILVFDPALIGPIGLLIDASELKLWGIHIWYELGEYDIDVRSQLTEEQLKQTENGSMRLNMIFLIRPHEKLMHLITRQIKLGASLRQRNILAFIPRPTEEIMTLFAQQLSPQLETLHSMGDIEIYPCPIYFFPYDTDVISLELYHVFRDFHAHSDPTPLITCSEAFAQLQTMLKGLLPRIWVVGNAGKFICDQLIRYRRELQMQLPHSTRDPSLMKQTTCSELHSQTPDIMTSQRIAIPPLHLFVPLQQTYQQQPHDIDHKRHNNIDSSFFSQFNAHLDDNLVIETGLSTPTVHYVPSPYDKWPDNVEDIILIDRRVDLITPFCTPFTYEALLDQVIGIHQTLISMKHFTPASDNTVSLNKPSSVDKQQLKPEKTKTSLTSSDSIFKDIRDLPQNCVGAFLHNKASDVQRTYQEKETLKSISEINVFMKRFKIKQSEHSSISLHCNLLTHISNYLKTSDFKEFLQLEDDIMSSANGNASASILNTIYNSLEDIASSQKTPHQVYRLLCLLSIVGGGIKTKLFNSLTKTLVQMFGIQEILRLHLMERAGLISGNPKKKNYWKDIKTAFNLIVEDTGGSKKISTTTIPEDMSYVCSGYAPLSIRLIECLYHQPGGWRTLSRVFDSLWGPTLEARQRLLTDMNNHTYSDIKQCQEQTLKDESSDTPIKTDATNYMINQPKSAIPVTLVFFIGGCTYSEIAALRHLGKTKDENKRRYVIITTEILNYKKLIDSFTPIEQSVKQT